MQSQHTLVLTVTVVRLRFTRYKLTKRLERAVDLKSARLLDTRVVRAACALACGTRGGGGAAEGLAAALLRRRRGGRWFVVFVFVFVR